VYNDVPALLEDGTAGLNTGSAVADLQLWVDMLENDLIPRESITDDHREMIERFSQGETAVIMIAPHMLRLVQESNPDVFEVMGVAPGITGTSGVNGVDVQSLVIPAGTEFPNASLALAQFVTSADVQTAFAQEVNIFPSNLVSYEDEFFQTMDETNPVSALRPLALEYVQNARNLRPTFPNDAEVQQAVLNAQNAALLGEATAQDALDTLVTEINALIGS
jgi:putative chitobiose transport system substrate-binding protein